MVAIADGDDDDEDDTLRAEETMVLQSMYEDEMEFAFGKRYAFGLKLDIDVYACELKVTLPKSYPACEPNFIALQIPALNNSGYEVLMKRLREELSSLDNEDSPMKVLHAIEWLKENLQTCIEQQELKKKLNLPFANDSAKQGKGSSDGSNDLLCNGFMREWCSFVSLYKDSYSSGPNRFEVLDTLANHRGLNITGLAIAGKPGGLVVEGKEKDVVEFMTLMRTEFFETLNPRGRKLTTRLQERWPLDDEVERYEAAKAKQNLVDDVHKKARRENEIPSKLKQNQILQNQRLAAWEESDRALVQAFEEKYRIKISVEEMNQLVSAGPPTFESVHKASLKEVYAMLMDPPTDEDIQERRKFKDFSVLTGGNNSGYETAYQDAGVLLKKMEMKHGFDAMFAYRFS